MRIYDINVPSLVTELKAWRFAPVGAEAMVIGFFLSFLFVCNSYPVPFLFSTCGH